MTKTRNDIKTNENLDIDARFLLANERTLLAWIRTSLAVEAGGVALIAVHRSQSGIGISILLLGAVVAIIGYHRYRQADLAIRKQQLPSVGIGPAIQVITVVGIPVLLSVAQFTILK
jgi:putative membrane protein